MRRALILLFAAFTAVDAVYLVLRSPLESVDRVFVGTVVLGLLLPAVVALVGLHRNSMPLVAAAGAMCALPALMAGTPVISFAGFLAIGGLARGPSPSDGERLRGIAVTILGIAAWIAPFIGSDGGRTPDGTWLGIAVALMVGTIALAGGRRTSRAVAVIER